MGLPSHFLVHLKLSTIRTSLSLGPGLHSKSVDRRQLSLLRSESVQFSCSVVSDSATPWTAARQASLSITNSRSLLKLMSTESVTPSNHLILCHPLLLPPSIFPSIRVFSNQSRESLFIKYHATPMMRFLFFCFLL